MTCNVSKKASLKDWHPADILAALRKRGYSLRDIARAEGLRDSSALSRALTHSYPINELRLARYAGVPVQEMFPTRYNPDGTKLPRGSAGERQRLRMKSTVSACQSNGNDRAGD